MNQPLTEPVFTLMRRSSEAAILPLYRSLAGRHVSTKAPGDLVTSADHESEAILAEGLAKLLPAASIVGEEAAHHDPSWRAKLDSSACWLIDPLDGTNNYAAGKAPFGIIVALAEAGETVAGWIYNPLTGRTCYAERGCGAYVNGQQIHSSGSGRHQPVVAISLALVDPRHTSRMRELLEGSSSLVDIPRCAAEQYPRLALGENDLVFFNRTFPWDHAAGVLFLNEAGGKAARHDGTPYLINDGKVGLLAAATPAIWDWSVELLSAL